MKTTIDIEDDLWDKFSVKVINDFGVRTKKTDVISELITGFIKGKYKLEELIKK